MSQTRRIGLISASSLLFLELGYILVLGIGLSTLPTPESQIQDPWFTVMEVLILMISPLLVLLFTALHYHTEPERRVYSLASVLFMLALCTVTMGLHFSILVLSRQAEFSVTPWINLVFPFRWPSVAYALDILAWDIFWPLSLLFSGLALKGPGIIRWVKYLFLLSALLAALGLLGIITGNMVHRNIGIIGYVPVFIVILILLIRLFTNPRSQA